jgi:hypothetical protein
MNCHVGDARVEPVSVSTLIPGDIPSMLFHVVDSTGEEQESLEVPHPTD